MIKEFKPVDWANGTNIYEVNIRQYTPEGTFNAFAKELTRLKDMGVQTLWFMPVTPIAKKKRKGSLGSYYACADYTAINPEFGTIDDFKDLIREAHAMDFKVIIDWVANHTGWDHVWTREHPDYYLKDESTQDFKTPEGMDDIIALDFHNPELVRAMIHAMKFWVEECAIDGFRCDLAFWVKLEFWKKARNQLDIVKPLFWLGEFDELVHPEYCEAFDASYTWTWMHATEDFYKKDLPLDSLLTVLKKYDDLGDSCMRAWFTCNHDENSWNGTEYEKYGDMAKALAVFSATWNGIPLLYSGQEIPNFKRLKFFDRDTIAWASAEPTLASFYKALLELHTKNPALRSGDPLVQTYRIKTSEPAHVLAYLRKKGANEVLVVLNLSGNNLGIEIIEERLRGIFRNVFSGAEYDLNMSMSFEMGSWEYRVYEK